jgi:DnaK suppressor protein
VASSKQIEELKATLLQKKEIINRNIESSKDSISSLEKSECNDDADFAEVSSDSFTEGLIANQQKAELLEVEVALKKIEDGTYGVCQMCDELIPINRLRAKPFAKFCTTCREVHEKETA